MDDKLNRQHIRRHENSSQVMTAPLLCSKELPTRFSTPSIPPPTAGHTSIKAPMKVANATTKTTPNAAPNVAPSVAPKATRIVARNMTVPSTALKAPHNVFPNTVSKAAPYVAHEIITEISIYYPIGFSGSCGGTSKPTTKKKAKIRQQQRKYDSNEDVKTAVKCSRTRTLQTCIEYVNLPSEVATEKPGQGSTLAACARHSKGGRLEMIVVVSRHALNSSIMVWGAFSGSGVSELAFLEGSQTTEKYVDTLAKYFFPFGHEFYGEQFTLMQDGDSIHRAHQTMEFLAEHNVQLFDHPALSPDLNPIENVWGVFARAVYANGRQFTAKTELILAIKRAWSNLGRPYLLTLAKSMPNRCVEVILAQGGKIDY
ncbi:hypothetical protein H257_05961 [Aphanomyces astaci]|uniref:Tc1-like transposase DDE domain-containing protein n=1 Tax=Aphanomyces astaci TaxID=112090 RepID=W4GNZ0_APHAT|nr:hypothetical protein H257_05961 [Aphanomyces astaci]ETV81437.1 hypothetical protein H257_05961 [Aphanomyces astaci]|eukprot:XP_009829295.1 hypothetical protein H257_05961 [Aphanomyces astaci]